MRTFFLIFLISISGIKLLGQDKSKTQDEIVKQIYSSAQIPCSIRHPEFMKAESENLVECQISKDLPYEISLSFNFKGESLITQPETFILSFRVANNSKEWLFKNNRNLTVFAGNENIIFNKAQKYTQSTSLSPSSSTAEQLYFEIDRATVSKLAKTEAIKFNLGNVESSVSEKTQSLFKSILDLGSIE